MTTNECSAAADAIQNSLIKRLLACNLVTATRARELECGDLYETVAECLHYTPLIEVPFPGAGESITFSREGMK